MPAKKISEMTNDELIYFLELWARGRKNINEIKVELLRRLKLLEETRGN
jgi:hypothetical protein